MNTRWVVLPFLVTVLLCDPDRAQTVDRDKVGKGKAVITTSEARPLILQSEYARWRDSLPDDYPQVADYRRVMLRWVAGAEELWGPDPERPDVGVCQFGVTKRNSVSHVRTARALPVYALTPHGSA